MDNSQKRSNAVVSMTAVNFSEMRISNNPVETLVAFSIGSGIGVAIHDSAGGVGGILNFILPDSTMANVTDPAKAPFMFADTGVTTLLNALYDQGAKAENLKVVIAGGAHIMGQTGIFNIGRKNLEALKATLGEYNLKVHHEATGGTKNRTISLEIGSGKSIIRTFGEGEERI
jgi:chemotaxis protein CheD